jgi:phosphoglycolate phosphatase-like HAD superfamily hydrolase
LPIKPLLNKLIQPPQTLAAAVHLPSPFTLPWKTIKSLNMAAPEQRAIVTGQDLTGQDLTGQDLAGHTSQQIPRSTAELTPDAVTRRDTQPYLQVENVHKEFGSFVALRDIYLNVYPGEFVCLLGPRTQPVHPTAGCLELFEWLRSRPIAIGLNTGFYREVTDIILSRLGWNQGLDSDYVDSPGSIIQVSVTPSEIYNQEGRSAPYMIQKAMYKLGIKDPQTVIAIGDTPSDLEAGMNAHCLMSLGIIHGTHTRSQLENYPNHGLLDSLGELKNKITAIENLV